MTHEEDALALLGIYQEKLRELRTTGKIPICFEDYAGFVAQTIILLPEDVRQTAADVVSAGLAQIGYMQAKEITDRLEGGEARRLKVIDDFLEQ